MFASISGKKVYDISMMIEPTMPVYKNREEKRPVFSVTSDFKEKGVYETRLTLDLHTGTHIDAPLHMIEGGKTIEQLDLEQFLTPCKVLDLTGVEGGIRDNDLDKTEVQINKGDFILLKTRNSLKNNPGEDFVFLEKSGARFLLEKGITGVGIDSLGIERDQPGHPTHKQLLSRKVILVEGLRLKEVGAGEYLLTLLPLKIKGVEAAPVRAFLIDR